MPMGAYGAAAHFHRVLSTVLSALPPSDVRMTQHYLDDIIIGGESQGMPRQVYAGAGLVDPERIQD
jgi:hypothetical protein